MRVAQVGLGCLGHLCRTGAPYRATGLASAVRSEERFADALISPPGHHPTKRVLSTASNYLAHSYTPAPLVPRSISSQSQSPPSQRHSAEFPWGSSTSLQTPLPIDALPRIPGQTLPSVQPALLGSAPSRSKRSHVVLAFPVTQARSRGSPNAPASTESGMMRADVSKTDGRLGARSTG